MTDKELLFEKFYEFLEMMRKELENNEEAEVTKIEIGFVDDFTIELYLWRGKPKVLK